MAITAVLTLQHPTTQVNTTVIGTVVISNSGGADVTLDSFVPQASKTGSSDSPSFNSLANFSLPQFGPSPQIVPAGGTLGVSFEMVAFAPQTLTVTADLSTSDGAQTRATSAGLVVGPVPQTSSGY